MSRVPIWCELVCRQCSETIVGEFSYGAIPRRELKTKASRDYGTVFKHDDVFCGEHCLSRFEREKQRKEGADT